MTGRTAPRAEAGFTLLELLVAITLLGIVMVPLATAFVVGGRTFENTRDRLEGSTSSLFTSAYWAGDVQSADSITTSGAPCAGTGVNVVTFAWAADPGATTTPTSLPVAMTKVSYARIDSGDGSQLVRVLCPAGGSPATNTVVPRLGSVSPVTCVPSCTFPVQATNEPITVTMTLSTASTPTEPAGVPFTVTGTRRSTS